MKNMREMISLMEGVMAVPGINQAAAAAGTGGSESDMQTASKAARGQNYAAFDAAMATQGNQAPTEEEVMSEKAPPGMEDVVMKLKKEYPDDHGRAFATAWSIYNKKHGKTEEGYSMEESVPAVDSCQQGNPADAVVACAMGENVSDLIYDQQYSRFSNLLNSFVEPQEAFDVLSREMIEQGIEGEEHDDIMQRLESDFFPEDSAFNMMDGPDDFSDDAEALASAGHGSDEDYGDFPMDEALDLQNGYDDINDASGNDFFPNGADSPVVSKVGPSGARQGDNPEQKKMQVAEVHKELVYGYRNFLKENAQESQKKS